MGDKTYVSLYVSKEKAEEFNKLKGVVHDDDIIQQYLDETKRDIKIDLDSLNDDILQYKAMASKWHKEMSKAYDSQVEKTELLFEKFDEQRPFFNEKVDQLKHAIQPVNSMIKDLEISMSKINSWKIEKLLDLINKISMMSGREKEMLKFLMTFE